MSAGWLVRSNGDPYESMSQPRYDYMDGGSLSPDGMSEMQVTFMLHSYPTKLASDTEKHALFSYDPYFYAATPFMELGVTPAGAGYVILQDGTTVTTPDGYIVLGEMCSLVVTYDAGSQDLVLELFGTNSFYGSTTSGSGTPQATAPAGTLSRVVLFNGYEGRSKMVCSVKSCRVFLGENVTWLPGRDGVMRATLASNATAYTNRQSWDLYPQWLQTSGAARLYGAIPTAPAEPPLRVTVYTDYERIVRETTYYRKVAA